MDYTKLTYLNCLAGEGFPCVLKGFLWGYYAWRKRAWCSFGERYRKIIAFNETGAKTYRGENV